MKRKRKTLSEYLISAIRRIWYFSTARRLVRKNATGCAICGKVCEQYDIDHKTPVGSRPIEWEGWDLYLTRMFEGELQALCQECHKTKTICDKENIRKAKKD